MARHLATLLLFARPSGIGDWSGVQTREHDVVDVEGAVRLALADNEVHSLVIEKI